MDLTEAVTLKIKNIVSETKLAIQVELNSGTYWIPRSQCRVINKKFYIPNWLAEKLQLDLRQDTNLPTKTIDNDEQPDNDTDN